MRRDTGESYQDFLTKLAQASGIETPTRADLARIDRKRKKKGSNDDWTHPHDPDAKITKMKDGRTHLAHKAEHAVDLETGAIVGVTVQDADDGDTTTSIETLIEAAEQVEAVRPDGDGIEEVVGDKGYHSNQSLVDLEAVGVRSYISEPDRGRRNWKKNPEARDAVYRNRRRIRGPRGQRLLRLRGERLERPFAHLYETGGMRRVHLRGHTNIRKRLLIHTGGFNLGLLMRQLIGVGTPRGLQGRLIAVVATLLTLIRPLWEPVPRHRPPVRLFSRSSVSRSRDTPSSTSACEKWLSPRAASCRLGVDQTGSHELDCARPGWFLWPFSQSACRRFMLKTRHNSETRQPDASSLHSCLECAFTFERTVVASRNPVL